MLQKPTAMGMAMGPQSPLTPLPGGWFRVGDYEESPERVRFDRVINGRMLRANLFYPDYYRTFTS